MPVPLTGARSATIITALLLAGFTTEALADVSKTGTTDKKALESNPVANIYYFGKTGSGPINFLD